MAIRQKMNIMIENLLKWLDKSTCNFLAASTVINELKRAGFEELKQNEQWQIKAGGKYFMVKNSSAVFAFTVPENLDSFKKGIKVIAAHSDSPCLRLKPNCEIYGEGGTVSLNVEKYGGGILYTWFDRPLSMSGRIMVKGRDPLNPEEIIFDYEKPIAIIPHLAIHFNRGVNEGNPISVQKDMKPVIGCYSEEEIADAKRNGGFILKSVAELTGARSEDIIGYEISLYPVAKACINGIKDDFISSPRIDDLSMVYAGLQALLDMSSNPSDHIRLLAIFDNEETGSGTKQGAASPVLRDLLERLCVCMGGEKQDFFAGIANSFMISADDAHAWHPNYNEKYDPTNHPKIGGGPVVKINSNCKYMTDARGAAVFRALCEDAGVKCQMFVNHADVAGGSTLGNILTGQLDFAGVDVGNAIWAMHSAVETASVSDHIDMVKVMTKFWES